MTRQEPDVNRSAPFPTGIDRLDLVLGGGLRRLSFTVVIGEPGSGKTTLAHQIAFSHASAEQPVLYFTALGEPSVKMLGHQQQFGFYDLDKVGDCLHFVSLADKALKEDKAGLIELLMREVDAYQASLVVVDSFRAMFPSSSQAQLQQFMQDLSLRLTTSHVTTLLVGEYVEETFQEHPVYSIADGVISLRQALLGNSMVRKMCVCKMRGQDPQPGLHTFRISKDGLQIFPRLLNPYQTGAPEASPKLVSIGIAGLDEMLGGGTFEGSSLIVAGPTGSGKSTVGLQFIVEGVRRGEPGVIALFEETIPKYIQQAKGLGVDLQRMIVEKQVEIVYKRPLDLSVDETLYSIEAAVDRLGARRVTLDSITGLESALAPSFRDEYHESLYRLMGAVTGKGINILMTVEISTSYAELQFTPHAISYLTHDIILQRYFEVEGQLNTFVSVIKTRGRKHSHDLRSYVITDTGMQVGPVLHGFEGIITAVPKLRATAAEEHPGLIATEKAMLAAVSQAGEISFERLQHATRLSTRDLTRGLRRLRDLGYIDRSSSLVQAVFRAAGR